MKIYSTTKDNKYLVSFDAVLKDEDKEILLEEIKKSGRTVNTKIEVKQHDRILIEQALEEFRFLAPAEVKVSKESTCMKVLEDGKFVEKYIYAVNIEALPSLYYILFDEDEELRDNAIKNLAAYVSRDQNGFLEVIAEKLHREDALDFDLDSEVQVRLVKLFYDSLDIELDSVSEMGNNIDSRVDNDNILAIKEFLEEYRYYLEDDDEDYDELLGEKKEDPNYYVYSLKKEKTTLNLGKIIV